LDSTIGSEFLDLLSNYWSSRRIPLSGVHYQQLMHCVHNFALTSLPTDQQTYPSCVTDALVAVQKTEKKKKKDDIHKQSQTIINSIIRAL
jgi:hypothetical protein